MSDGLADTPLTETYFDTTLWRMLVRLAPDIDMDRHSPSQDPVALLDVISSGLFGAKEATWAGFTVVARAIAATPDLTDGEHLFVAITKLRQLLLSGTADNDSDTPAGQAFALILAVGILAGRVFGEDAAEILAMRDIADDALRAKAGRGNHAKALNATRTTWHSPSLSRANELRTKYPYRSDAKLADVIIADASLNPAPPSTQALLQAMKKWRQDGLLNKRRRAEE